MAKYLFLEAHIDDNILACGGTITRLKEEGHDITAITLSCIYEGIDLTEEWINAMDKLDIERFEKMNFETRYFNTQYDKILQYLFTIQKHNFDFVFTHSSNCIHMDHSTVGKVSERVFKHTNLITYTHPWNTRDHKTNYFVKLNADHIETKRVALKCYESQKNRSYMSSDYIWANALNTGVMAGTKYAEGFNVVNLIQ